MGGFGVSAGSIGTVSHRLCLLYRREPEESCSFSHRLVIYEKQAGRVHPHVLHAVWLSCVRNAVLGNRALHPAMVSNPSVLVHLLLKLRLLIDDIAVFCIFNKSSLNSVLSYVTYDQGEDVHWSFFELRNPILLYDFLAGRAQQLLQGMVPGRKHTPGYRLYDHLLGPVPFH